MNRDLERVVEIPEGIEVVTKGSEVSMKKGDRELKREFDVGKISIKVGEKAERAASGIPSKKGTEVPISSGKVVLSVKSATRRESKMMGTIWAHLKNMIKGVEEDFEYKMEICNVHFPMNVKVEGEKVVIKSFLGETKERVARIMPGVKVDIKGTDVTVSSNNIESAGQTAANIEKATRLTGRDRRIFQDGIFITEKCGRAL